MIALRTLGEFTVTRAESGAATALRPRERALLLLLAGAGAGGLDRESVLGLLWPDSSETHARGSLKQLVFLLHRALGQVAVCSESGQLRLDGAIVQADAWRFLEALRRRDHHGVVAAYTGTFAEAYVPPQGLDGLAQWVEARRSSYRSSYAAALRVLATEATTAGAVDDLIDCRRRLVELEPLSSRATLALMQAHVLAGDRTAALAVARMHARRVRAELEVAPDPALLDYERQIRQAPGMLGMERPTAPLVADVAPARQPGALHAFDGVMLGLDRVR